MESDIRYYFEVLLRRKWVIAGFLAVVTATTAIGTWMQRPIYLASALLLIEKEQATYSGAREGAVIESSQVDYYQSQYHILKSRSLLRKMADKLQLAEHPRFANLGGELIEVLGRQIAISPVRNTRLVNVLAESVEPELAMRMANTLSELFIEQHRESRLFLSKQILDSLDHETDQNSIESFESLPSVVENRLIQELKVQHAELESQLSNLRKAYTEKHPAVIQLSRQIGTLKGRIDSEVIKIAKSVKSELSGELKGNNVRIIDRAELPLKPDRPRKGVNLALATLIGLILGCALAFLIDRLDLTIKSQEEMERVLKIPFLGALPRIPSSALANSRSLYTLTLESTNSFSSESFRNIRTSLAYSSPQGAPHSFLVTSSVAGEGKTVFSCNLAIVFAQFGEKVLLIDGDLRKPMVNKAFGLSSEKGASSFLVGNEDPDSLVEDVGVPNLKVLPCGPRPPNPGDLLVSTKLRRLLDWAKANYDRVIVDCTPLHPISDAIIWSQHVQGVVFVAHSTKVSAVMTSQAIGKLRKANCPVVGGIINQITFEGGGYYNYYYTYGGDGDAGKTKSRSRGHSPRPARA